MLKLRMLGDLPPHPQYSFVAWGGGGGVTLPLSLLRQLSKGGDTSKRDCTTQMQKCIIKESSLKLPCSKTMMEVEQNKAKDLDVLLRKM
jgi:hypothetical protein